MEMSVTPSKPQRSAIGAGTAKRRRNCYHIGLASMEVRATCSQRRLSASDARNAMYESAPRGGTAEAGVGAISGGCGTIAGDANSYCPDLGACKVVWYSAIPCVRIARASMPRNRACVHATDTHHATNTSGGFIRRAQTRLNTEERAGGQAPPLGGGTNAPRISGPNAATNCAFGIRAFGLKPDAVQGRARVV